jgi:hypothetical protein
MVTTMMLTQNKYFGIAALLLAIIPIPDIMTLVKNKILRRRRAELIDLSSILHQAAQTSQTEMLLGEASRQADGRNHLTKSAAVERDPKKWLLH